MLGNHYETVNTKVECKDNLHTDAHMIFCQELIKKLPDAATVIMTQLSLKAGMKSWKVK